MEFRQHEFTHAFFGGTESTGFRVPRGIFCLPLWNFREEGTFHESRAATGIEKNVNFFHVFRFGRFFAYVQPSDSDGRSVCTFNFFPAT